MSFNVLLQQTLSMLCHKLSYLPVTVGYVILEFRCCMVFLFKLVHQTKIGLGNELSIEATSLPPENPTWLSIQQRIMITMYTVCGAVDAIKDRFWSGDDAEFVVSFVISNRINIFTKLRLPFS